MGPGVEGLPPDVVPSSETLGLAAVGKVVFVFVGDDLGGEQAAGDAGKPGGRDDGRAGLSQQDFVHFELELGGVELLAARTEEPLLEGGDDLVLAGDLGPEAGGFGLEQHDLLLHFHFPEAKEQGFEIRCVAFFH